MCLRPDISLSISVEHRKFWVCSDCIFSNWFGLSFGENVFLGKEGNRLVPELKGLYEAYHLPYFRRHKKSAGKGNLDWKLFADNRKESLVKKSSAVVLVIRLRVVENRQNKLESTGPNSW